MFKIRILSKKDVSEVLDMQSVINTVEAVYRAKSEGETNAWPTVFYDFDPGKADMDIKSGYLKNEKLFGHKTMTWFETNEKKRIPTLIGTIVVFDAETGAPLGLMDASYITGMRTGAAGALGAKYLANNDSENLLIVGAGNQSIFQIAASLTVLPNIKKVYVAAKNPLHAKKFVDCVSSRLSNEFGIDSRPIIFEAVNDLEEAVKDSRVIITVTASRAPVIKSEWIQTGTHISCIGADMQGKQELDSEILSRSRIFVDDKTQCIHVGEIEIPLKRGIINEENIIGEIGDLLLGKVKGRTSNEQITVFDSTGMALLDIAAAKVALHEAEKMRLGTIAEI